MKQEQFKKAVDIKERIVVEKHNLNIIKDNFIPNIQNELNEIIPKSIIDEFAGKCISHINENINALEKQFNEL